MLGNPNGYPFQYITLIIRILCLLSVGWHRMLMILHVREYINTGGKSSNIGGGGGGSGPPVPTPLRNVRRVQEHTCTQCTGVYGRMYECTRSTGECTRSTGLYAEYKLFMSYGIESPQADDDLYDT